MKKIHSYLAILIIIVSIYPLSTNAQIFKNILNLAKNRAAQATKAKDSAAVFGPKYDSLTAAAHQMAADTAGMMGNMSKPGSGVTVSSADSATYIKSLMTATGGNGIAFQYLTTSSTKKSQNIKDTMSMFITYSGESHVDMSSNMILISHGTQSKYRYTALLYPSYKSFTLSISDTSALSSSDKSTYRFSKIGNETVEGYNCIHSKLTITNGNIIITEDLWTSTEVPGYSVIKKMMGSQRNVTIKMLQAMEQAGCMGFIVKLETQNQYISMTMLLANIKQKNLPASLFEIPSDYTHAPGNNLMYPMMGQGIKK